jgi:ABC-2 type transport system permease protein
MRFREIVTFEIAYRLRSGTTWLFAVLLIGLPMLMMQAFSDSPQPLDSPHRIAIMVGAGSILGMLVSAGIFGDAATRDFATGTHPLFFTVPLSKLEYVAGRFVGAFVVNAALMVLLIVGLVAGRFMPYDEPPTFLPFAIARYAQAYLLIGLPNLLFTSAILFAASLLSRHVLASYLTAIGLFFAYIISGEYTTGLASRQFGLLLDPFGLNVIQFTIGELSVAARDTTLLAFQGIVAGNRLLWVGVGLATLVWAYGKFRFDAARLRMWFGRARVATHPERSMSEGSVVDLPIPRVARDDLRSFGTRTAWHQVFAIAHRALADILSSRIFQLVLLGAVIIVFAAGWDVGTVVFDTSTWPVTHLVATIMRGPGAPAIVLLIALYAGELVWRERDTRVAEIADTEPTPVWVPYVGKFLALVGMIIVFQAVNMGAGLMLQAVRGYYRFELLVYAQFLFGFLLATYVLIAALAMIVHVFVNQKHVGHLVVVLIFFIIITRGALIGLRHRLLVYSSDPGWVYSDMNGFGPFTWPFVWLKLYWAAWALLLGIAGVLVYVRGTESGWRQRAQGARQRLTRGPLRAVAIATGLILTLGGWVFYNTNILNEYQSPDEAIAAMVDQERLLKQFEGAAQPTIVGADLRVEIHPDHGAVDMTGTYRLVNATVRPIDSVHVMAGAVVDVRALSFDRTSELVFQARPRQQWRTYRLEPALEPGDTLRLTFDHGYARRGFPNDGVPTAVAKNGAYFDRRWLPMIGYQQAFELEGARERKKHGLPPQAWPTVADSEALQNRSGNRDADRVHTDIVIGTAGDQIAVTTGSLVRDWTENGRRYFQYRTDEPVWFGLPFMSAKYAVREDRWNDVKLKIFYHPAHDFNLGRMFASMKGSLDYFTKNFGPLQFDELRIVEFPRYASFARAHPQTIAFGEGSAFLTRIEEGDIDRTFFVVAHEVAHQWWGHQVAGAGVEGAAMLSETLAMYSAMMVMEHTYGRENVKRFFDYEMDRIRMTTPLLPLLRVRDQSGVYYNKGAVAMYTLKEYVGEERVNAALRSYLTRWRNAGPPYPTSLDLYRELQAVTPDSVKPLLVDLFETVTAWGVRVAAARADQVGPNEYRVTIDVAGEKVRYDTVGKETALPLDDVLEIGVFPATGSRAVGEPLYLRKHRIRGNRQSVTVTVDKQPFRVAVDPYHWLIQRGRSEEGSSKRDKIADLKETRGSGGDSTRWSAEYVARRAKDSLNLKFRGF